MENSITTYNTYRVMPVSNTNRAMPCYIK